MRKIVVALLVIVLAGCAGGEDLRQADEAVAQFHSELNGGDYETIYGSAATGFKNVSSKADATKLFEAVHRKLGAYKSGKRTNWKANYSTSGNNLVLQYDSKFERGDATELFTFVRDGHGVRLFGYNINSPVLITG
jgi:hypothetical protein